MENKKMNYMPNMNAEIIPFQSAAGFCLGMKFDNFICNVKYIHASDDFICNKHSIENISNMEIWRIKDETISDFFDSSQLHRIVHCYWNHDVLLVFSGQDCVLESITLGQNYHGKLSGCVGVNDVIGHFSDGYDFEIYADACYLMPKNSQDDAVIGAEIHLSNLDINSKEFLEQRIIGIRIYSQ
ncbi:hypothetical protein CPI40_06470 [Moraxella catarrhalis]|jgi:hypothetical protein|nr:hypothetical protein [Moraxella catarrhalis]MPW49387.1 hypothetical protein [Moraxella catarrhalis]MPW59668.1 hypothetical protein [Moraxella catarrhalis]MPW68445.1 hypothetical protein [Moraxella catarrhalis]MPW70054.1 hypothetical protein [Moraxella catarrhalis]